MAVNPESILDTVKKSIGFDPEYTAFDLDIIIQINSAFGTLTQFGVGSVTGFAITDNTTLWSQYVADLTVLGMVKSYIYMAVRLAFDPPGTSFGIDAVKTQLAELGWRINVAIETSTPPSDPFGLQEILEVAGEGATVYEGGVMPTYFAPKLVVLDFKPVVTPDASEGNVFYLTLTGNCTINAPVNSADAEHITLGLTSGGFAVTWGPGWNFGDAGEPQLSSDKTDVISAVYRASSTEWHAGYTTGF
jgi:hypothetical protein